MPPQKIVAMGKRGRGAARTGKGSAKPQGGGVSKPGLKIKLNFGQAASQAPQDDTPSPVIYSNHNKQEVEDKEHSSLSITNSGVGTRRSGRVPKKREDPDYAFGSEMNHLSELSPVRKVDDEDAYQPRHLPSSPPPRQAPQIITLGSSPQPSRRHAGCSRKTQPFTSTLTQISQDENPSSSTIQASHVYPSPHGFIPAFVADETTFQLMDLLCGKSNIPIDLPTLTEPTSDAEKPYSAVALTHLYITAYRASQHNLCDLIADTWIRGFHALRRCHENRHRDAMLWRPNTALLQRGKKGFTPAAPNWARELPVEDPQLAADALDFSPSLLALLYAETRHGAGGRLLWADALALCGSKMEPRMQKRGETWHPEFVRDVCCSALRMARRKLTLKIEEEGEGAWCKRYHEHGKAGAVCYRRAAWERKIGGEETSDEDENQVGEMVAGKGKEKEKEKRGLDHEAEMGSAKRVRIEDREVVDEDAEGESDD